MKACSVKIRSLQVPGSCQSGMGAAHPTAVFAFSVQTEHEASPASFLAGG